MTIVLDLPDSTSVLGLTRVYTNTEGLQNFSMHALTAADGLLVTKDASPDGKFVVVTPAEKKEATNEA